MRRASRTRPSRRFALSGRPRRLDLHTSGQAPVAVSGGADATFGFPRHGAPNGVAAVHPRPTTAKPRPRTALAEPPATKRGRMQVSCAGPSPRGDETSAADSRIERSWQRSNPSTSLRTPAGWCGTSPYREQQQLPRSRPTRLRNRRCSAYSSPDGCSSSDHPRSATGPLDRSAPVSCPGAPWVVRTTSRPTRATGPSLMHCHRQRQALGEESAESAPCTLEGIRVARDRMSWRTPSHFDRASRERAAERLSLASLMGLPRWRYLLHDCSKLCRDPAAPTPLCHLAECRGARPWGLERRERRFSSVRAGVPFAADGSACLQVTSWQSQLRPTERTWSCGAGTTR